MKKIIVIVMLSLFIISFGSQEKNTLKTKKVFSVLIDNMIKNSEVDAALLVKGYMPDQEPYTIKTEILIESDSGELFIKEQTINGSELIHS